MLQRNARVTPAELVDEARITVEQGYTIAYRIYGTGTRTLVGLHGGPGPSSAYIERLNEVLGDDMRLVLYDQLGSGDSDWPDDPSLWQVQRFIDEVETVRTTLDLGVVSLYGQSWGGMLALAYTLQYPANVEALVLSNTYANGTAYLLDISDHRVSLGAGRHAAMLRHEGAGTLDDPEYLDAVAELYARHVFRTSPYDAEASRAGLKKIDEQYFPAMGPAYALWGPHEFMGTGPQAHYNITDRLPEIAVPALIVCGWFDELTPERCSRPLAEGIPDNEYVVFGNSSHLTILEKEAEAYLAVIRDFLQRRLGV